MNVAAIDIAVLRRLLICGVAIVASGSVCLVRAEERPEPKTPIVSVSLSLVQVDAVVQDNKGRYLSDLGCDEFQILEDGKAQEIANCSFVSASPSPGATGATVAPGSRPLARENVRRTIALVVDDLNLDLLSIQSLRTGLLNYIDKDVAPGDLVALVRTASGATSLQQFTTDKRVLRAAINRIRFNPLASVDIFASVGAIPALPRRGEGEGKYEFAQTIADTMAGGAISTLRFVLNGLRDLPGRKSLVFFSNGYGLRTPKNFHTGFGGAIPALVDLANRASVVIYSVDTAGVVYGANTAAVSMSSANWDNPGMIREKNGLDGIGALAEPTGGLLMKGLNDLRVQLTRVMDDQAGYYLVGYVPRASSLSASGAPMFHRLQIKVRRKGAKVRSRSGFYGVADDDARLRSAVPQTSLVAQLTSPFSASDVGINMSTAFLRDAVRGPLLHSFLQVSPEDLTLTSDPDGGSTSSVEIVALTLNADGQPVDQIRRTGDLRLSAQARGVAARAGITYTIDVPIKAPGAYQLRVAFRDIVSGRVGSAYEYVDVPDLSKGKLATSGIVMTKAVPGGGEGQPDESSTSEAIGSAAARAFGPGDQVWYALTAYNAKQDVSTKKPRLQSQAQLLLDGKSVAMTAPHLLETDKSSIDTENLIGGTLVLPSSMPDGDYQLLVTVEDLLSKGKDRIATQVATFSVHRAQAGQ